MKENSFAYNNKTITFFNGYLDINNYSIEDLFPNITIPDILICSLCVVQLESAYVFRELCRQAAIICSSKYSSKQIIKYEKADEIDNDSLVYNELVSDENNQHLRNWESTKEAEIDTENRVEPTCSNGPKEHDNDPKTKKFSCPECKNKYSSPQTLAVHKKIVHLKIHFPCKMCSTACRTQAALTHHVLGHHKNSKIACKTCGKLFKSRIGLYLHNKSTHLGILYKCNECPKKFKSSSGLNSHKLKTHKNAL
jgi:hypothetical protein